MNVYAIKDFELGITVNHKAQGVAEVMFDYLPWHSLNLAITFEYSNGWIVIDNVTGFKYEVTRL